MEQAAMAPDKEHHQGHGNAAQVDFYTPVVQQDRLNTDFRTLIEQDRFSPARGIIDR